MKVTSRFLVEDPNPGLTPEQLERARKAFIARENSKRSTGPTSPEGKARSAQNARKHGFSGATIVIEDEDKQAFAAHLDAYFDSFRPINQAECDQVRKIAISQWRYDRLLAIESGLLDLELVHRKFPMDASLGNLESHHYLAITFQELTSATKALDLCQRYLNQASRETDRAIRTFYLLKQNRPEPEAEPAPEASQNQQERNELTPVQAPALSDQQADRSPGSSSAERPDQPVQEENNLRQQFI